MALNWSLLLVTAKYKKEEFNPLPNSNQMPHVLRLFPFGLIARQGHFKSKASFKPARVVKLKLPVVMRQLRFVQ